MSSSWMVLMTNGETEEERMEVETEVRTNICSY